MKAFLKKIGKVIVFPFVWFWKHVLFPVFKFLWKVIKEVGKFLKKFWWILLIIVALIFFLVWPGGLLTHKGWAWDWFDKKPVASAVSTPSINDNQSTLAPAEVKETPTPTEVEQKATDTPTDQPVLLASGIYLEWKDESDSYRQKDGTYLIPVQDLIDLDSGARAILFEGEFYNSVGTHSVCYVTGEFANGCKVEGGKIHINQGSFWAYHANVKGVSPDDLLMVFAHDKWQNWHNQGIKGNPMEIYISVKTAVFAEGEEPSLSPQQVIIADNNAAERCPADKPALLENPYSDTDAKTNPVVIGAPGSFSCRTLFIGKLTADGDLVSYYWKGAKDGFSYVASATSFYLVPDSWGETEMKGFAETQKAAFQGVYTTK